jgi:hypothetical protein
MQQVRQQMMQLLGTMGEALVRDAKAEDVPVQAEEVKVALPF